MRKSYATFIAASFTVSLVIGACGGKASAEDCKKFADHFGVLMTNGQEGQAAEITRQVADGMKEELIKDCNERGTKADIDCALAAKTMEDLEKCSGGSRAK